MAVPYGQSRVRKVPNVRPNRLLAPSATTTYRAWMARVRPSASATGAEKAAALYRAGKARWVLVSGGNKPGDEDVVPEAEAMAVVLRALGVPAVAVPGVHGMAGPLQFELAADAGDA